MANKEYELEMVDNELTLTVYGFDISKHVNFELDRDWFGGEPVNDCVDCCQYILNRGFITRTLFVLVKHGFKEV